jgi:hypothetical protein
VASDANIAQDQCLTRVIDTRLSLAQPPFVKERLRGLCHWLTTGGLHCPDYMPTLPIIQLCGIVRL